MTGIKSAAFVVGALASIMGCYTISLRASGERAAVGAAHEQIARDMAEMRLLRTELRTRSRLPELQRWNEQVLALAPPRAEQLMTSPVMLASYAPTTAPMAVAPAPVATVVAVVRDAPAAAPVLHRTSFIARRAHDLVADAAAVGGLAAAPAGFQKIALR